MGLREAEGSGASGKHTVSHWALNTQPQAVPPSRPWELCVCTGPGSHGIVGRTLQVWGPMPSPSPPKMHYPPLGPRPVPEARDKNISFENKDLMRLCRVI